MPVLPREPQPRRSPKQRAKNIRIEERRTEVLRLAEQKMSARQIADRFGLSVTTVYKDIEAVLKERRAQRQHWGDLVFEDHLAQLEAMILKVSERLYLQETQHDPTTGKVTTTPTERLDMRMVQQWQSLMAERAKLLGLYPQEKTATAPTQQNNFYIDLGGSGSRSPILPDVPTIAGHAHPISTSTEDDDDEMLDDDTPVGDGMDTDADAD